MLDWERWTLTHSSAGDAVLVLPPVLVALSGLGLAATLSSSVAAAVVAVGVAWVVAVAVAWVVSVAVAWVVSVAVGWVVSVAVAWVVAVADGEVVGEAEGEVEMAAWLTRAEADPDGVSLALAEWLADEMSDGDAEADVDVEGDVDVVGEVEVEVDGDGEGEELACDGNAWHAVFVSGEVAMGAACALPAMPRARKLPLSRVAAATLTCPKRMRIACLR
jgi:hypothetical protein